MVPYLINERRLGVLLPVRVSPQMSNLSAQLVPEGSWATSGSPGRFSSLFAASKPTND